MCHFFPLTPSEKLIVIPVL